MPSFDNFAPFFGKVSGKLRRGGRGIRTPGAMKPNGFQDRRNRPLCHPSSVKASGTAIPANFFEPVPLSPPSFSDLFPLPPGVAAGGRVGA